MITAGRRRRVRAEAEPDGPRSDRGRPAGRPRGAPAGRTVSPECGDGGPAYGAQPWNGQASARSAAAFGHTVYHSAPFSWMRYVEASVFWPVLSNRTPL
jgi:hypothetical protein